MDRGVLLVSELAFCKHFSDDHKLLINRAYKTISEALKGRTRENGDSLINHALAIARIAVEEMGLMSSVVTAILLHEAFPLNKDEKTAMEERRNAGKKVVREKSGSKSITNQEWNEWIEKESERKKKLINTISLDYGKEIASLVQSLNNIAEIDLKNTSLQAENFRKLIVSYSVDPRVTIIKLLDRLEVMRSLHFFPKSKQDKKALETFLLYAPLAHQLGLYHIKSELEDLSMKFTDPEMYRYISNKLKTTWDEREKLIADFVKPIHAILVKQGFRYEIKSRTKSVYSIWKKMQSQKVDFEGVYDIFAIRIILDSPTESEKDDCWKVFSEVTSYYEHDTSRMRDWITVPRTSGYESLHATVKTSSGKMMEVQIRSTRMDDIAERGSAAHWRYKGVKQERGLQTWLDNVRKLLETETPDTEKAKNYFSNFSLNEIIVFTKDGDIRRLPTGASVIDFAFDVHTLVGQRCVGALVNGKNVPIKEILRTGDVVEILTGKNQTPNKDWLRWTVTSKAKNRIRQKLREEETSLAQVGKEILDRRLKNWKLTLNDELFGTLLKHFKYKQVTDFYAAIAAEKIDIADVKEQILAAQEVPEPEVLPERSIRKVGEDDAATSDCLIMDERLNNVGYKLSKCCSPILGDEVFGFVTINDGIKIHRITCPNAGRLLDKYPYRIIKAKWNDSGKTNIFQATIKIAGFEETGIVNTVGETVTKHGYNLRSINIATSGNTFDGRLVVLVSSNKQLEQLLYHLRKIRGVQKVTRVAS